MSEYAYTDADDKPIEAGARVMLAGWKPGNAFATEAEAYGTIQSISDPDGDVDDEGRSIGIPPRATVLFDDGVQDEFTGHWQGRWWDDDAPFRFDDLQVVND